MRCFLAISLALAFVLSGCVEADAPDLGDARQFHAYRVYYAGADVGGLRLDDVLEEEGQGDWRSTRWTFVYGKCNPPATSENGCPPPVQIRNYSTCSLWADAVNQGRPLYDFRGARARGGSSGLEGPLELFTGRTTVKISSERPSLVKLAARRLRDVHQVQAPSHLPPPVPGSLEGKLPCQDKPSS